MYQTYSGRNRFKSTGFTLIEILLAIGILAILATAAIIAINPARQFAEARNSQRWSDVNAIMNAVTQYSVGHNGLIPPEIPIDGDPVEICISGSASCPGVMGLDSLTDNSTYLTEVPIDPSCPGSCPDYSTGYFIAKNAEGRIYIQAPYSELDETIELIR